MATSVSTTSFPVEAVPQAPEDPLFGLMRAYRADQSKDKVDLVGFPFEKHVTRLKLYPASLLTSPLRRRALERTEMTMRSRGFFPWSRRYL